MMILDFTLQKMKILLRGNILIWWSHKEVAGWSMRFLIYKTNIGVIETIDQFISYYVCYFLFNANKYVWENLNKNKKKYKLFIQNFIVKYCFYRARE